jgi:prepilin-type processing-associated H-X9-DG protein
LILELDKQKMATKDVKQVREWMARLVREGRLRVPKTIDEVEHEAQSTGGPGTVTDDGWAELHSAMKTYVKEHDDKLPDTLQELEPYIGSERNFLWATNNVEYLGQGKIRKMNKAKAASTPVAYDKTMLKEGNGTNVLFLDSHVEYLTREKSKELDIGGVPILIDVSFLTVSDGLLKSVGLDPNTLEGSGWVNFGAPNSGGPVAFAFDEPNVELLLKAVQTREDYKLLAHPKFFATEGKQARIAVVSQAHFIEGVYEPNSSSQAPKPEPEKLLFGTSIKLTPGLTPDAKNVTLDLDIEIRRFTSREQRDDDYYVHQLPGLSILHTTNRITVRDGKTLPIVGQRIVQAVLLTEQEFSHQEALWGNRSRIRGVFRQSIVVEKPARLLILIKPTVDPQVQPPPELRPLDSL